MSFSHGLQSPSIGQPKNGYTLRETDGWSTRTVTEPLVYLNGQFVPASQAHVAIYDAGLVLGATITDQTRTFHLRPFRLGDHVHRLFRAARYARLELGLTPAELVCTSEELIDRNSRLVDKGDELGLIHFVT